MDDNIAIKVENVTKTFKLPHERQNSLKSTLINFRNRGYEKQVALKDISFDVKKGEFFGIVGRNGSGKSTLLKLLAGIYTPDSGNIHVSGKLTPFIELGVGFNPELSGRDNVFLNGALLGFNHKEMESMYDEIVEFAELERFMDQKLKNYSSGMQVRLAFSIAIRANTDILVLDEVLAVGDANFQRKCLNYFKELKKNKKTVIFVSHDMAAVQEFCDKAIILGSGTKRFEGRAQEAAAIYNEMNFGQGSKTPKKDKTVHYGDGSINIESVVLESKGRPTNHLGPNDVINFSIALKANKKIENAVLGLQIDDSSDHTILSYSNTTDSLDISPSGSERITVHLSTNNILHNGSYTVSVALKSSDKLETYDQVLRVLKFEVSGWNMATAFVHPTFKTELQKDDRHYD